MTIDDFKIEIKKQTKFGDWIVNAVIEGVLEIRGFRLSQSKFQGFYLKPPTVRDKRTGKYFWIVEFKDSQLWKQLEVKVKEKIAEFEEENEELEKAIREVK